MSKVFVIDTYGNPLNPIHPGRARILLTQGEASVFRRYPFTIILKTEVQQASVEPLRIKLDPGSKTTGIAIVNDATGEVVFAAELSQEGRRLKNHSIVGVLVATTDEHARRDTGKRVFKIGKTRKRAGSPPLSRAE